MSDLAGRVRQLAGRRGAVILAHNYQKPEVQDVADRVGDSLELARWSANADAEVIVFCGVRFMAETAKILAPDRTVLLPDPEAECPLARMITAREVRELRRQHPGAAVVTYVNSTAEVKAESDICCTSSNAVGAVAAIDPGRPVVFVPDCHLGDWVRRQTGREMVLHPGYCHVHVSILTADVERARREHPGAPIVVHPECTRDVVDPADAVLSTSGTCRYARKTSADTVIVGTEVGLLHRLRKENPGKRFYALSARAVCPNMKRTDLARLLRSLDEFSHEIRVEPSIATRARVALDRMLERVA